MKIKKILFAFLAIVIVTLLPHSGFIPGPFVYSIPILLFIWLYLKYFGESFSDLGFRLKSCSLKSFLVGSAVAILTVAFMQLIFFPALENLVEFEEVQVELYDKLRGNTGFYIFILVMSWIIGGLYEEIVFHGFIFTRLEKMIGGKYATLLGFLITAIIFGAYHIQLGSEDVLNAALVGAGYHALILYYKRNLWYGIFAHAVYDTIVITLLYLGHI